MPEPAGDPTAVSDLSHRLLSTPEGRLDPCPLYEALRQVAPVLEARPGIWLISGYEQARSVLRDPRFVRGYGRTQELLRPEGLQRPATVLGSATLVNLDGPSHTRVRQMVSRSFRSATVDALQLPIASAIDELADRLHDAGGGDLVTSFTAPLPRRVIATVLGVPAEEAQAFDNQARNLTAVLEPDPSPEALSAADEAAQELEQFFDQLLAARRRRPRQDLLSELAQGGQGVTAAEVTALAVLLFVAGYDNVTNQVGNAVLGLCAEPWQADLVRHQAWRCASLADEVVRHDASVQLTVRTADEAVALAGATMAPGDLALVLLGAANRDPVRYEDPARLDLLRTGIHPLSFGGGVHHCVGFALARSEVTLALKGLFSRFEVIEVTEEATYGDRLTFRGPLSIPVNVSATGARRAAVFAPTARQAHPHQPARPSQEVGPELAVRPVEGQDHLWRTAYRASLESRPRRGAQEIEGLIDLFGRVRFFAGCSRSELAELVATAYPLAFESDETICAEGSSSGECWVIAEGEAVVTVEGQVVATVHADSVVGERGLLLNRPRAASVVAAEHLIAYAVSKQRLVRLVNASPTARQGMLDDVRQRYGTDLDEAS